MNEYGYKLLPGVIEREGCNVPITHKCYCKQNKATGYR